MEMNWKKFLAAPANGDLIVQVYRDEKFLVDAVGLFITEGLKNREGVILLTTPSRWKVIAQFLQNRGFDPDEFCPTGQLQVFPAEKILSRLMQDGVPDWDSFSRVIGELIAVSRKQYPKLRAYGEMANILWQKGNPRAALRLEEMWNDLAKLYAFALFCVYIQSPRTVKLAAKRKLFQPRYVPGADPSLLDRALNQASREILGGEILAGIHRMLEESRSNNESLPAAPAVLLWLRDNMPTTSEKVLARMRKLLSE